MRQAHAHHRVAGLQHREKDRLIRLRPRMRLHVGVLGIEQLFDAIDREPFGNVDEFAAAVVTLARIALGILVG
jgi:hypothetical protein